MDREALDFGNDLFRVDPLAGECRHGKVWGKCEAEECHEIWLMNQEQIAESQQQKNEWVYALIARKSGARKNLNMRLRSKRRESRTLTITKLGFRRTAIKMKPSRKVQGNLSGMFFPIKLPCKRPCNSRR